MKPEKDIYKVVQWATGSLGKKCIRAIQEVPHLELVGCWVSSDAKHGKDAGDIADCGALGVSATMSKEDIFALDADVVHYSPPQFQDLNWVDDVCHLLKSGKNVISPLHFSWIDGDNTMNAIEAAGQEGNAFFYGSGIYPDWTTMRMLLGSTALCHKIKKITLTEQSARILEFNMAEKAVFEVLQFGMPVEEIGANPMATSFYDCFEFELKNIAAALGYEVEGFVREQEHTLATREIRHPQYTRYIKKGTLAGWKTSISAVIHGKPMIEIVSYHAADATAIDKDWNITDDASYVVDIDAQPPTRTTWNTLDSDSMNAAEALYEVTSMNNLNVIPGIVSARPGIVCASDMHQMTCGYGRLDFS